LGGYLNYSEAARRVAFARDNGIATDAMVYEPSDWGNNLLKD
jgi:hypothetical protein